MKCQEEDADCPNETVGVDIQGRHLCEAHLAFSRAVQLMINQEFDRIGHPELVPDEFRLPQEKAKDN